MGKMINQTKIQQVEDLSKKVEKAESFFLVNFKGVNAGLMNRLRQEARRSGGDFLVVKNSLFNKALINQGINLDEQSLTGPTACIFGQEEEVNALKAVFELLKKEGVEANFKGGAILNKKEPLILKIEEISELANLPSFNELISKTILGIEGPLIRMQLVLSGLLGNFILILKQINQTKKIEGGEN